MIHLVDINVLIALSDPSHPHEPAAACFFKDYAMRDGWATCPIVENGFLRIFGARRYPGGPGSPTAARLVLGSLLSAPGYQFWPDDLSILETATFPTLPVSDDLTDLYLLALAVKRHARFATLDAGIDASLIPDGTHAYHLISS